VELTLNVDLVFAGDNAFRALCEADVAASLGRSAREVVWLRHSAGSVVVEFGISGIDKAPDGGQVAAWVHATLAGGSKTVGGAAVLGVHVLQAPDEPRRTPTPAPNVGVDAPNDDGGDGSILVIVVGAVAVIVGVMVLALVCCLWRQKRTSKLARFRVPAVATEPAVPVPPRPGTALRPEQQSQQPIAAPATAPASPPDPAPVAESQRPQPRSPPVPSSVNR
jgi:hypothetical protein